MHTVYLLKNPKPVNEQGTYLNPQAAGKIIKAKDGWDDHPACAMFNIVS